VPVYTSPGRSGNEPFGWGLSLPSIMRKTDEGLPKYRDVDESDVFVLSGAEDLVPVLVEVGGQRRRVRAHGGTAFSVPAAVRGVVRSHRALDERADR